MGRRWLVLALVSMLMLSLWSVPLASAQPDVESAAAQLDGSVSGSPVAVPEAFATAATGPGGSYVPLAPIRVLDTRNTTQGEISSAVGRRQTVSQRVAGVGGVPADASAVAINITAVTPTAPGFLTVWPSGRTRPTASSINFPAGAVVGNFVIAEVGNQGRVDIYNHDGSTHVVFDVVGYLPAGADYVPLTPTRVLDTRNTTQGELSAPVGPRQTVAQRVAGVGGVPSNAKAVAINITAVTPTAAGFLTVWPAGKTRPTVSSINFAAGEVVGNFVIAEVGSNGRVSIYNHNGEVDVVFDVVGYLPATANYVPLTPTRVLDTRNTSQGELSAPVARRQTVSQRVAGVGGVPADASAVAINITAVTPTAPGFLTVWPSGRTRPEASSINFPAGGVVGNFVIAEVGANGRVDIYNHDGNTHVVFDIVGYYPRIQTRARIAAGTDHTCAIDKHGTPWCWGYNNYGQLGDGTTTTRLVPVRVQGLTNVVDIQAAGAHTCAIDADGAAWCWGRNVSGVLGDGTTSSRSLPVRVVGLPDVTSISIFGSHACAVDRQGDAWCWGRNVEGQLGDGTTTGRTTPARVIGLTDVVSIGVAGTYQTGIGAAYSHTCAVDQSGDAWCWGSNNVGQLGDGVMAAGVTPRPQRVLGLPPVVSVEAGRGHSCAIDRAGDQWCWGYNASGRLGDGTTTARSLPVRTSVLTNVAATSSLNDHRCAVDRSTKPWCWGSNGSGRLGDGTSTGRRVPTAVVGLDRVLQITAGGIHTCAIDLAGDPWCWGSNTNGRLGDGTTVTRPTPVRVTPYP